MKKMTKAQVIAHVKKHGEWVGRIVPNKMIPLPYHPFDLSVETRFILNGQGFPVRCNAYGEIMPMEAYVNEFAYYNCHLETGKRVHYYQTA